MITRILILLLSAFSLTACENYPKYASDPPPKSSYLKDASITGNVKQAIAFDSLLNASKIHVSSTGGVVILTGQVQTQSEILRAIQLANQTTGVKLVESNLVVVPPLR